MSIAKHVLVIVDKREGTASRKKDSTDLMTLWASLASSALTYQLASYPLPIGDIWICSSDQGPFYIPPAWQFPPIGDVSSTGTVDETPMSRETLDNFFEMPTAGEANSNILNLPNSNLGAPSAVSSSLSSAPIDPMDPMDPPLLSGAKFPPERPDIVIERKALADLKASYGDGRYKDQKARLVNCDGGMVVLLVEGFKGSQVKDASLKKRYLSTFVHSMFRDNIGVYHTGNIQESFDFLHHTATEMALGKLERTADYMQRTKYTDNIQMTRKQNLTPARGLEMQLACIPGVSAKMARAVQTKYASMSELCRAYDELGRIAHDSADAAERARHNLLADLSFRGPSGKEQRLASRSSKIYQYVTGTESEPPAKKAKKAKRAKKDKDIK